MDHVQIHISAYKTQRSQQIPAHSLRLARILSLQERRALRNIPLGLGTYRDYCDGMSFLSVFFYNRYC